MSTSSTCALSTVFDLNEINIPVRTKFLSQFHHVTFRHVLEFPAPFGLELIHISADERGAASSKNDQHMTRQVKKGGP
jgi:hypothetical protein